MEPLLAVVTVVSLTLGAAMSLVAWKLLRHQREQSAARIEALQALSTEPAEPIHNEPIHNRPIHSGPIHNQPIRNDPAPRPVTTFTTLDDAPIARTDAAAPPQAPLPTSQPPQPPVPIPQPAAARAHSDDPAAWDAMRDRPAPRSSAAAMEIPVHFGSAIEPRAPGRRWAALAAVAGVMALGFGSVYTLYTTDAATVFNRLFTASASPATAEPLQLLSLKHTTDESGAFVLTGLVQNPASGRPLQGVVAVVYLFDQDGRYFAGGKTPIELTSFHPGEESPFVVKVPAAAGVARYRIGFRMEGGGVVAHVDRRGQMPGGTVEDTAGDGGRLVAPPLPGRSEG
jgi:hypothetical protein